MKPRTQFNSQALAAGSPAYRMSRAAPAPDGNRAQRRAWAKLNRRRPVPGKPTDQDQT